MKFHLNNKSIKIKHVCGFIVKGPPVPQTGGVRGALNSGTEVQTVTLSGDQKNVTVDQKKRCSSLSRQLEALELWSMQTRPERESALKTVWV